MQPKELGIDEQRFPEWRSQQFDAIQEIVDSENRVVLVEGPTGVGKSLIMASAFRLAKEKGYILTSTKQLQQQYSEDFPFIYPITGRGNFECLIAEDTSCDKGPCKQGVKCPVSIHCPYIVQRTLGLRQQISVQNYPYFLLSANYAGAIPSRDIVVGDEAHLLDSELIRFLTVQLNRRDLAEYNLKPPRVGCKDFEEWREWARSNKTFVYLALEKARAQAAESAEIGILDPRIGRDLIILQNLDTALYRLQHLDDTWAIFQTRGGEEFKPTFPGKMGSDAILNFTRKLVLCSATILKPEIHLRALGLEDVPYTFVKLSSPFHPSNRPVIYMPATKVNRKMSQDNEDRLIAAVDGLVGKFIKGGRGIIHTHTYKLAQLVLDKSKFSGRMITYQPGGREEGLRKFKAGEADVFVAPSMSTGVDFPHDDARWQIILKIPFPDLGDPQIARRKALDPEWYDFQTVSGIIQTAGRIVRAPDDYGTTVIIDANFWWFYKSQDKLFPKWFKDAVRWKK